MDHRPRPPEAFLKKAAADLSVSGLGGKSQAGPSFMNCHMLKALDGTDNTGEKTRVLMLQAEMRFRSAARTVKKF